MSQVPKNNRYRYGTVAILAARGEVFIFLTHLKKMRFFIFANTVPSFFILRTIAKRKFEYFLQFF